jgi:hypothetical protein
MRVLLISLVALSAGSCAFLDDQMEAYYETREELVADGAVQRGWVPPWLPVSAARIHEVHNLDTNDVWMRFEFDTSELSSIPECSRSATTKFSDARGPWRQRWWSASNKYDWRGYTCGWDHDGKSRHARMAVAAEPGIALYWEE